ncbi:MAG: accessory gene regulator B family protein [Lachnospiraceae bacterium]|nr:accessory gene regulator B family protein [Lachnospiraceae bacterium]
MDRLVRGILLKIQTEELVDKEDIEIYQFGLECILLKLIHIASYLLIGICMGEVFSLLVSGSILIPLRRKAGGYHAKTRMGCYIFSCFVVCLLCLFNKVTIAPIVGIIGLVVADTLILMFAPVENENRMLEPDEKILFRKQAIGLLVSVNIVVLAILFIHKYLFVAYWMEKGVIFTGVLLALGVKKKRQTES